jgi:putative thioredoxin
VTVPYILEGTAENFGALVVENSRRGLVVVDFWAPWVGPSLRQQAMWTEVARALPGRFLLVTVNTDDQKELAADYAVRSLPSCKLFRHGRVVDELHGVQPEGDYRRIVEKHLAGADPVRREALAAWQAGDQGQALRLLAGAAMADPSDPAVPELMVKLLLQAGRHQDALAVLESLPPEVRRDAALRRLRAHARFVAAADGAPPADLLDAQVAAKPADSAARFRLAAVLLVADDYEAAVAQLLELVRREPGWENGLAREGLLALFDTLGDDAGLVRRARQALAALGDDSRGQTP